MDVPAFVTVEEYLARTEKPNCDYVDGVLYPKPFAGWKHSRTQGCLSCLLAQRFRDFEVAIEVTVRIRPGKYRVPDIVLERRGQIDGPYPTEPVHLCVEILSPEDRVSEIFAKCEDYHVWGVEMTWIIDPESQRAWEYRKGFRPMEIRPGESLTAEEISIPLYDVFSE